MILKLRDQDPIVSFLGPIILKDLLKDAIFHMFSLPHLQRIVFFGLKFHYKVYAMRKLFHITDYRKLPVPLSHQCRHNRFYLKQWPPSHKSSLITQFLFQIIINFFKLIKICHSTFSLKILLLPLSIYKAHTIVVKHKTKHDGHVPHDHHKQSILHPQL